MRYLYVILTYLITPLLGLHLLWRGLGNRDYLRRVGERFGRGPTRLERRSVWIHAVSVGEVQASEPLVRALKERFPDRTFVVTTVTPTGSQRARELFGDDVVHSYAPYDLAHAVKRFFDWANPQLAIILETELWPNLYHECDQRSVPLVLASARVSQKSVDRYMRFISLFRQTLSYGILIGAQTEADAARFVSLGAPENRAHVTGNIKFDFELPEDVGPRGVAFRANNDATGRPVWVAASTHANEEEQVLAAHRRVLATRPDALLILVPRHPERFAAVGSMVEKQGLSCVRRSEEKPFTTDTQVFLGDSMGELTMFYGASDVAFVGGSLVEIGGHNLLEPAALGLPIVVGPHNFNAQDIADLMIAEGAARQVADADQLGDEVLELLADPEVRTWAGGLGKEALAQNRGTLRRLLNLVEPVIDAGGLS